MRSLMSTFSIVLLLATATMAEEEETPEPSVVLDLDRGSFRAFLGWKTPVLVSADGQIKPLLAEKKKRGEGEGEPEQEPQPVPVVSSVRPPADWAAAEFDDGAWPRFRGPALIAQWYGGSIYTPGNPAEWNIVCLRGKFRVGDPSKLGALKLALRYYGGAVVYVNGKELLRAHLPKGQLDFDTLADRYPDETYLRPDGKLYGEGDEKQFAEALAKRVRELPPTPGSEGVAVPTSMLRRGVNVIAVEVHAAPVRDLAVTEQAANVSWRGPPTPWPHAGVAAARLTAEPDTGLVPNAGPEQGIYAWAVHPISTLTAWDFAHPSEKLRPVRIVGARNGVFSGRVAVSSAGTITGLRAEASDLVSATGNERIPAAAVSVRYAEQTRPETSWAGAYRFDRLLDDAPGEIALTEFHLRGREVQPAPCATVPIWLTVRVPKDAAPGEYRGTLTVRAQGAEPVVFPVELTVHDWQVPDPERFVVHHNLYASQESVALYYDVPLWSEEHFELMGKSLEILPQVAGKICVVNLVVGAANLGNRESMVRWIKQSDGSYRYDFEVFDRYLDLYEAEVGKPAILRLNVWGQKGKTHYPVSVLDPSTGKLDTMLQPPYGTPENEAFWRPVLTEVRKRLEKRGWFDVTAVGYTRYCGDPIPETVSVYQAIWPDGKWINTSHGNPSRYKALEGEMPVPYSEWVWSCGWLYNPDLRERHPLYPRAWTAGASRIELANVRVGTGIIGHLRDYSPLVAYRMVSEAALQGGLRGIGRVGADFWPVPVGTDGKREPMCTSQFAVGPPNSVMAMLSPGPAGAVFNERLEMFREGVQTAEAIIFIQQALEANRLGDALAGRCEKLLDERARYYLRTRPGQPRHWLAFEASGWQERDGRLFALAGEVARAAAGE